MDERDIETKAVDAYFQRSGEHAPAPSADPTTINEGGQDYVVLENTYGLLAVYEIVDGDTLKWSDYLPEGYSEDDDQRNG